MNNFCLLFSYLYLIKTDICNFWGISLLNNNTYTYTHSTLTLSELITFLMQALMGQMCTYLSLSHSFLIYNIWPLVTLNNQWSLVEESWVTSRVDLKRAVISTHTSWNPDLGTQAWCREDAYRPYERPTWKRTEASILRSAIFQIATNTNLLSSVSLF